MIEKILKRLEAEKGKVTNYEECSEHRRLAQQWNNCIDECKKIVQEVAKEYGTASDNDLVVVSALPSLYPLQKFEEEAIHKVVASARNGGWILCSERLPQEDEPVTALCKIINITLKDGTVACGWCNRYLEKWYVLDEHCDYPVPRKYEDVLAWMPLPSAPYQKGE